MHASSESEPHNENNPEERYAFRKASIQDKLSTLSQRLDEHGIEDRIHWGHVGDLAFVDERLGEILGFFNIPEDRIEG